MPARPRPARPGCGRPPPAARPHDGEHPAHAVPTTQPPTASTTSREATARQATPPTGPPTLRPTSGNAVFNFGKTTASEPYVSPIYADLTSLPPTLVQVAASEALFDEVQRLVETLKRYGNDVAFEQYDDAFHVFQNIAQLPETAKALSSIASFVQANAGQSAGTLAQSIDQ
ncbi:alpha/beta hydrolase fold domain-containing protein [Streptomyces sp. NPDC086549]|uniref:alpha/beta hydrolase fold domain-containing protein n=1 Tax=Streptomyces sp. NPDC086549 TaxID=3365752 RepID=UPI00380FA4DB